MTATERKLRQIILTGPSRVLIDAHGNCVPAWKARRKYHIEAQVVFLREDGWSLGAPIGLEKAAYELWKDQWCAYIDLRTGEWTFMF